MNKKPWGGRFSKNTDTMVEEFTSSVDFDKRLYKYDIKGSIAHCKMLERCKIINDDEAKKIINGLEVIRKEIEENRFNFKQEYEDIHMNIEKRLTDLIGSVGGKLHTARSRNDQVALDIRMYSKDEVSVIIKIINQLKMIIAAVAKDNIDIVMPGYTHLQKAQPILFSHHILAYYEMFNRDEGRFKDMLKRIDVMPLGAAAMAGTSFPVDRKFAADTLAFSKITANSVDSVSDRDFAIELCSTSSILMMHLSRLCEELIIWSSSEFNFVELDDAFCTGSSIMPQKKNPDVCELVRGKTGRIYGNLIALLTMMKSLPLSYNRDMQEDKESIFDTVDTVKSCTIIISQLLKKIRLNKDVLLAAVKKNFITATDIADYLVKKGLPFRDAHEVVGKIVAYCIKEGKQFDEVKLDKLKNFSEFIEKDIYEYTDVNSSINNKDVYGGTSKTRVLRRIEEIKGKGV